MNSDLTVVIVDDVEASLQTSNRSMTPEMVNAKNSFLRAYTQLLSHSFFTVVYPIEKIRAQLDQITTTGKCLSLDRRVYRTGALLVGDSFSVDENGASVVICKAGFEATRDIVSALPDQLFTIEDSCAVSGNTIQYVATCVGNLGRSVSQINVGIASQRAVNCLQAISGRVEVVATYSRLKCTELRNLLLDEPQFELRGGVVQQSLLTKEISILEALPLSHVQFIDAVDLVRTTRQILCGFLNDYRSV